MAIKPAPLAKTKRGAKGGNKKGGVKKASKKG